MARRNQFTVDAESVQGNASAKVTFRCLTVGEWRAWAQDEARDDLDLLRAHVTAWVDFEDDQGLPLPDPPEGLDELYFHEKNALVRLLLEGAEGANVLKN